LILHWNSEGGGEKSFMEHIQFTQGKMNEERKEKAAALYCFLPPSSLSSPRKDFFPQYFSLIKERPSHQKKSR
jgi:hypothetical protein